MSYYCESTLFLHTHNFTWGTVTHSHPYMPTGPHTHTSSECQTIQFLTNLLFTFSGTTFIAFIFRATPIFQAPRLHALAKYILENCSLRAPPAIV